MKNQRGHWVCWMSTSTFYERTETHIHPLVSFRRKAVSGMSHDTYIRDVIPILQVEITLDRDETNDDRCWYGGWIIDHLSFVDI